MPCTVWCDRAPFTVEQSLADATKSLQDAVEGGHVKFLLFNRATDGRVVVLNVSRISALEEQRDPTESWSKRGCK